MSAECPPLYYETHGTHGPHVLMVHGNNSARSHWLPNLAGFCAYTRPVVVELYGHGRSPSPADPACYHPDRYVEHFERIREEVGAERWLLVGQSLGAALTLRYSLERPERAIAHAFTNSASAFASPDVRERMAENRAALQRRMERGELPDPAESPLNPARNRRISAEVRAALEADVALHDRVGLAMTSMHTTPYASNYERIGEIAVPTLLVVGEREQRFAANRRFIEQHLPGVQVAGLNGGHGVNLDVPDDFNAAVRRFFEPYIEREHEGARAAGG